MLEMPEKSSCKHLKKDDFIMISTKLPSTINIAIENGEKTYTKGNAF